MEAGRSCCEQADPIYQMMASDPVNLVPSVGSVNAERSNHPFGLVAGSAPTRFGQCRMLIENGIAQPPADRRGDIARIYAYMSRAYGLTLPKEQADLYTSWMATDPVSQEERAINSAIAKTGHRPNPLVMTGP